MTAAAPDREGSDRAAALATRDVGRRLLLAGVLAFTTALAALAAGAAETWRFTLMLAGRTAVLAAEPVAASSLAVRITSSAAALLAVLTLANLTSALAVLTSAAAARNSMLPPRSFRSLAARMLVPGWNLYGAGQVMAEALRSLFQTAGPPDAAGPPDVAASSIPRRIRIVAAVAWLVWIANGLLAGIIVTMSLVRVLPTSWTPAWAGRWPTSNQFAGNLVELHIALNVLAAVTAILVAILLALLRDEWRGRRRRRLDSWLVAQPRSTARNLPADPRSSPADRPEPEAVIDEIAGASADSGAHSGQHGRR